MPTQKTKALLRTHIFSYITRKSQKDIYFTFRIQGKVLPIMNSHNDGFYHKFTYYLQQIQIKFDPLNSNKYEDIEWKNNHRLVYSNNPTYEQVSYLNPTPTLLRDGFEIKRKFEKEVPINLTIYLYLHFPYHEYKLKKGLSEILGITQETRPVILYHLWKYIKLNALQDNDNPNYVITNEPLRKLFKCERFEISKLASFIIEHIEQPDPIIIPFTINLNENYKENQKLEDIIITIEDPHFKELLNWLSNSDKESLLFPKQNKIKTESNVNRYLTEIKECEKKMEELIQDMTKHKYKHDFYESYAKDPIKFLNNFIIQQNTLLKILDNNNAPDMKMDIYTSEYYKEYEDELRDFIELEFNKKNF